MLAYAVILVEFVLSGRFRSISARLGMDVTMRVHQLFARTALALALLHPFLYRGAFNPALPWDATRQFTLTDDFGALASGIAAWVLLPGFVLLAMGRDRIGFSYETWRWMHGLGAVLIAGLLLHHTLAAGRYSTEAPLAVLWAVLLGIAVLSLVNVYVFKPLLQRRRAWTVASVKPAGLKTWELTLQPDGHDGLSYEAGQFVWLNVGHSAFSLRENPFSISSAPGTGPALQFVIKELGDFTRTLGQVAPGTRAYLDGPHGNLVVAGRGEPGIALLAGGVGVAPLLGILRQLRLEGDTRPTSLVYGNRVAEQISYRDELDALARDHGTEVVHVLSEPPRDWQGRIGMLDAAVVRELFSAPEKRDWLYVLCGPPAMMAAVEDCLIDLGVPARQILSERFTYD
ncbi:ferredoxin reductase family protein [Pelagibius sp. CAU 1746]|uniref:ferredoxin reductase family protein n=1 Tax=Pelagibius sp. CAU 1746 TaxID=3140370 RepID=UPI00325C107B